MRIRFPLVFVVIIVGTLFSACSKHPEGVLSDSRMADLLADMELAQAYGDMAQGVVSSEDDRKRIRQQVLKDNGVTERELERSLDWYGMNMDKYIKLQDKVASILRKRMAKVVGTQSEEYEAGAGLWPYPQMIRTFANAFTNAMNFSIKPEGIVKGDAIELSGYIVQPAQGVRLLFGVDYTDGAGSFITRSLNGGRFSANLQTDSTRTVKRIFARLKLEGFDTSGSIILDSLFMMRRSLEPTTYHNFFQQMAYRIVGTNGSQQAPATMPAPSMGAPIGAPGMPMSTSPGEASTSVPKPMTHT